VSQPVNRVFELRFDSHQLAESQRDLIRNLQNAEKTIIRKANKGLIQFANFVLTESLKITPIYQRHNDHHHQNRMASGHLRSSGNVMYDLNNTNSVLTTPQGPRLTFTSLAPNIQDEIMDIFITYSAVYSHYQHHGMTRGGRPFRYTEKRAKRLFLQTTIAKEYKKLLQAIRNALDSGGV
jgi:hypothetical protein